MPEVRERRTVSSWQEGNSNSNNYSLQSRYTEEHLSVCITWTLKADGLQQHKTTPGVTLVRNRKLRSSLE